MVDRQILSLLAAILLLATAGPAPAAEEKAPEAGAAAEAPPKAYALSEVTLRAEETRKELLEMRRRLEPVAVVAAIDEQIPTRQHLVADAERNTKDILAQGAASLKLLDDLEREWLARQKGLGAWREQITTRAAAIDTELARLDNLSIRWKATRVSAKEAKTTAALQWIDGTREDLEATDGVAQERARALVDLLSGVASVERTVAIALQDVRNARDLRRSRLLDPDRPPLWAARPEGDLEGAIGRIREDWQRDVETLRAFFELKSDRVIQHLLLLLASLLAAVVLRRGVGRWAEEEPELAEAARVLQYPFSVALLVALVSAGSFYPLAPGVVSDLVGTALLIPALRLLPPLVERPVRPLIYGLAGFYLFSQVRELLDGAPVLARYLFTVEVVAAFAFVIWLTRPARLERIERPSRLLAFLGIVLRGLLALFVVAFLANLLGYFAFASILGQGALSSLYGAVILYGAYRVMRIIVSVTLRTDTARQLRMVRVGAAKIERWTERLLRIGAIVVWLDHALDVFAIRDVVYKTLLAILTTPFAAGTLSISLADILAFAVTIAAAFLLSGFIRFVLQEDVFPRVVMRRGVSNAVSTTVHYAILIFGLLLALAAAGVDLSRVTLLAGAFGVGIGFGLQNIVNNFVSGLILLFERPIQVGDTIEAAGLLGDVKRIGPRSSTVRTFDGAEVIVPNGMLISDQVTNWTLSDRRRRVIVGVGVAYGTDPEQVLEILREVAQENETVQDDPAPLTVFQGFGDSSLAFELRCWIPRYEEGFTMRSQLWVAINRKLREAGIEIPFPQRDLHLRSVDKPAREALGVARRGDDSPETESGS